MNSVGPSRASPSAPRPPPNPEAHSSPNAAANSSSCRIPAISIPSGPASPISSATSTSTSLSHSSESTNDSPSSPRSLGRTSPASSTRTIPVSSRAREMLDPIVPHPGNNSGSNSNSAPTSPFHLSSRRFKPVNREPRCDLNPLTPLELANILSKDSQVLLIDVRPYTMFSFTHIRDAVSICIPSTLLKRQTFGFRKIMDFVAPQDVEMLNKAEQCSYIVFYDQFTTNCAKDSTLNRTAAKFLDADIALAPKLHWLVGGLGAMAHDVPELIDAGDDLIASFPSDESNAVNQDSNSEKAGTTDDTPKLTLSSVKAAPRSPFSLLPVVTSVGASLGSPINTPSRSYPPLDESSSIHADGEIATRLPEFPQWLVNAVKRTESGQNVLAEAFQRLQAAEKQRVTPAGVQREPRSARLLSPALRVITPRSTPSTPFSDSSITSMRSASSTNTSPMNFKQNYAQSYAQHHADNPVQVKVSQSSGSSPNSEAHHHQRDERTSAPGQTKHETDSSVSPILSKETVPSPSTNQFMIVAGDDPRKNRYTNIAPFGYNRVLVRDSEYLNASYIRSRISPLQYIATQAPVPASFGDFWWCVYEQKVPLIMMLTTLRTESGQVKGNKYWFNSEYDGLSVELIDEHEQGTTGAGHGLVIRHIQLTSPEGFVHSVVHVQYENWPDLGCPADPNDVLNLVELKKQIMQNVDECSNVIVHCSAGCGRTGTFCTIDTVTDYLSRLTWEQTQNDPNDRVLEVVSEFREQRIAMVQNQRQLLLCYESVMLWYLKQLENISSLPQL